MKPLYVDLDARDAAVESWHRVTCLLSADASQRKNRRALDAELEISITFLGQYRVDELRLMGQMLKSYIQRTPPAHDGSKTKRRLEYKQRLFLAILYTRDRKIDCLEQLLEPLIFSKGHGHNRQNLGPCKFGAMQYAFAKHSRWFEKEELRALRRRLGTDGLGNYVQMQRFIRLVETGNYVQAVACFEESTCLTNDLIPTT